MVSFGLQGPFGPECCFLTKISCDGDSAQDCPGKWIHLRLKIIENRTWCSHIMTVSDQVVLNPDKKGQEQCGTLRNNDQKADDCRFQRGV